MKKAALLTIIVILTFCNANSQITKGNWLVGGNLSYSSTHYESSISSKQNSATLFISPTVGYFLADKLAAGLKVTINSSHQDVGFTALTGSATIKQQAFSFGPFLRYYFLPIDKIANLFIDGNYQYGINKTEYSITSTLNSNTYSVSAGSAIFFNSSVAIEFSLGYSGLKFSNYNGVNSNFIAGIGLQFHLQKE